MPPRRISKRHYKTRPAFVVVSVNPDGTVDAVFNSAADAAKLYGVVTSTINHYCRTESVGLGKKWFYEENFRKIYMACEWEKLHFTLPDDYVPKRKSFYKGHKKGNGWEKKSDESKRKQKEAAAQRAKMLNESGKNRLGALNNMKPVVCITDGNEFPSIRHAAEFYGIPRGSVRHCAHRVGVTHNLKFRFKSQLENIKNVI